MELPHRQNSVIANDEARSLTGAVGSRVPGIHRAWRFFTFIMPRSTDPFRKHAVLIKNLE